MFRAKEGRSMEGHESQCNGEKEREKRNKAVSGASKSINCNPITADKR